MKNEIQSLTKIHSHLTFFQIELFLGLEYVILNTLGNKSHGSVENKEHT